ncbi:hypothetical protein ACIQAC_37875 [Streptomyces sp. NPDC088387]|uniref:hypothetical protein n=1 Tax=Streptomyces sp. NPDC088387 TaxID=3365859 RepID=UPI00380589F8
MTQQQTPAVAYLEALRERLTADGCAVTSDTWAGQRVLVGSRADRKARWMGTKVKLFVYAAAVPALDVPAIGEFSVWAMTRAKADRGGLPGARNAAMVLAALVSENVDPAAAQWAAQDARTVDTTVVGRPITVETGPQSVRTTMYRGRVMWGGMFTGHVLEKAARYFP